MSKSVEDLQNQLQDAEAEVSAIKQEIAKRHGESSDPDIRNDGTDGTDRDDKEAMAARVTEDPEDLDAVDRLKIGPDGTGTQGEVTHAVKPAVPNTAAKKG